MEIIKENPVVSIIVPCYNLADYLPDALSSILNQTFSSWECIIVDNGSSDNTQNISEPFINKDGRFKYFFQKNQGVSSARNFGIKNSYGKYILPLDADDKIGPKYLQEGIEILEKNPLIKIVYCEAELFGAMKGKWNLPPFSIERMLCENSIFCSAIFRRDDYDKTKGYNEQMLIGFEDWDFWLELLKEGGEVYKIPKLHFYYRIRLSSRNNSLDEEAQRLLRHNIYENHKALYDKYLKVPDALYDWYLKKEALIKIKASKEYRLGKFLLSPLRKIKTQFTKK